MVNVLDRYGRPMEAPTQKDLEEELMAPSMGSVRSPFGGHPADGLTPVRLGVILREAEIGDATAYLEMAEQMEEKDLHYGGVLGTRKRAIRKMELVVTPGDDTDQAQMAAELTRDALEMSGVKDDFIDLLDGLGKGYSCCEQIWDTSGKHWKIVQFKHRMPQWFRFDTTDGETPLWRDNSGDLPLSYGKFVFHRPKIKTGLPIRGGLARLSAWGYLFKNFNLRDWAIFVEAYGHPLRMGRYGPNATVEDKRTLLRAVRSIGTDLAAILPKSMDVEIVQSQANGNNDNYEKNARYWDEQISKGVLGQVSTTDAIAGGHAVGKVHNEVREDIRDADAEQLANTLQRDVAGPLTYLNFGPDVPVPKVELKAPDEFDPAMQMKAVQVLGARGLKVATSQLREIYGLRAPEEGEEVLDFEKKPAPKGPKGSDLEVTKVSASAKAAIGQSAADIATGSDVAAVMSPLFEELIEAITTAETEEEMRDLLDQAQEDLPSDEVTTLMAQMLNMARLTGETNYNGL